MKIVLTGISATPYAREYISNAARTLRERGHDVFVPHEGNWQPPDKPAEADRFDFEATYQALREADLLMTVLDGYIVDDAVAAQIGMFYAYSREGKHPRRIVGILHDTRVAGWDWTGGDRALSPQIRQIILSIGKVYPNFKHAMAALDAEPEKA
jgi:hypothetical protein